MKTDTAHYDFSAPDGRSVQVWAFFVDGRVHQLTVIVSPHWLPEDVNFSFQGKAA